MQAPAIALRKVVALFVDDGSLALAVLVWVAATWLLTRWFSIADSWGGGLLFAGLGAILAENAIRSARQAR
jgi:hypothetical protein